jgi:hypothetical protein
VKAPIKAEREQEALGVGLGAILGDSSNHKASPRGRLRRLIESVGWNTDAEIRESQIIC